jgi:hypothetical protein
MKNCSYNLMEKFKSKEKHLITIFKIEIITNKTLIIIIISNFKKINIEMQTIILI